MRAGWPQSTWADDIKHERKVALKVLKPELAAVVGAERFLAEIKTTANLQHPHILPLFDSGEADSFVFYVMPYVGGESLREKLDREHQLPVDDAVQIATNIAEGLSYAHSRGVIHRDIKPANILLQAGKPVVSDFGIALALGAAGAGRLTETGLSLGTPQYMSPEQATGDLSVGASTDIYALGCVLYEMLVGEPPFTGSTPQAILGKIIAGKLESATEHRRSVPPNVDGAVRKALEKLPADRFASAQDLARALGDEHFRYGELATSGAGAGYWKRLAMLFAGSTVALALAFGWALLGPSQELAEVPVRERLSGLQMTGHDGSGEHLTISPDGSMYVLESEEDGTRKLFLRRADELEWTEILGTEGTTHAAFSPDSRWLLFGGTAEFALRATGVGGEIRLVEVTGGPSRLVTNGQYPNWVLQDTIVFSRPDGIYRISPSGSDLTLITAFDSTNAFARPHLLPDGEAVLFQGPGSLDTRGLKIVELASGAVSDLGLSGSNPRYVSTGHLLYGHANQELMAVPFDLGTHSVTGEPLVVLPDVLVYGGGATQFDVSQTGTALYGLPAARDRQLVRFDLNGARTPLPVSGNFNHPRFSPDGQRLVYDSGNQIWIYDPVTGENSQFTSGWNYGFPWWSRDGRYVYYSGWAGGSVNYDPMRRLADGSEEEELLYRRDEGHDRPLALSLDGEQLLVEVQSPQRGRDMLLWTDTDDNDGLSDYLRADWDEERGAISPDGAWLAYMSNESGVMEVYLRSFPGPEGQQRVSVGGGTHPVWAPDGSAIYYRDGIRVMKASLTNAGTPSVASRETLFETDALARYDWDVHPDGESFVAVVGPATEESEVDGVPIIRVRVVVNWFEELRERMGGN